MSRDLQKVHNDRFVSMEPWPVGDRIGFLSTAELSQKIEAIASDASYRGAVLQVDGLLSIAGELRCLAAEMEALR